MDHSHEKVISYIDTFHRAQMEKHFPARFAIWEISQATGCNPRSIERILNMLRTIKLVGKMPRGYKHKYWECTSRWTNTSDVIAKFEMAYAMRDEF